MERELPYFKFTVAKWLTGGIVFEPLNIQGLFINICALYWQKKGKLALEDINRRYKNPPELQQLTDRFISVNDGFISISFLDDQFEDRKQLSTTNSKNGKKGGRPKAPSIVENKPTANRPLTDRKANESNIEKKREEKNKNVERKIPFSLSEIFEKEKFAAAFPGWPKEKLLYYYEAADTWSTEGNKKIDWVKTIKNWAKRDEAKGELKFGPSVPVVETLEERSKRLSEANHP